MQRWRVDPGSYQWLDMVKANVWIFQGKNTRARAMLEQMLAGRSWSQLPRPELFPMMPAFALLTQGRLCLTEGQAQECINLMDTGLKHFSNSFASLILQLMKAEASRQLHGEGMAGLNQSLRALSNKNIGVHFVKWIPSLNTEEQATPADADTSISAELKASLSERELEVLHKIAEGLSNQEIADQLFISLHTVKTHARKINVKLGAKSRTQAIHRAQELQLF